MEIKINLYVIRKDRDLMEGKSELIKLHFPQKNTRSGDFVLQSCPGMAQSEKM